MGKKNRSTPKTEKLKTTFQDKLRINDLVQEVLERASTIELTSKAGEWESYLEIYKLLQEIRALQKSPSPVPAEPGRLQRLQLLRSWLLAGGGSADRLQPAVGGPLGAGLVCTDHLDETEVAIEVPRALMMTLETARATPLGELLARDKLCGALPQLGLTLHVLEESLAQESRWAPYLRSLPADYDTVLYWTPDDIQLLRGSPCFDDAIKQCRNIARQYAYYHGVLHNTKSQPLGKTLNMTNNFTYDRYRWAASTVMTRMNNIPSERDPDKSLPGLIPFWDLCNHSNGRVSTDYVSEKAASICYASHQFDAGEQFFIFYGVRPNSEYLLHNGFVYADNEHDAVAVRLGVSRADALHERRARLLRRLGVPASGLFYLHREGAPIDASLLAFLRVFNMDQEALEHWLPSEDVQALGCDSCPGLPAGLDSVAWQYLHTRVGLLLRLYPEPADTDRRLLAVEPGEHGQLGQHGRMAVTLRLGEKEILQRALEYACRRME